MKDGNGTRRNARIVKVFSLALLGLVAASLLLVHGSTYEPAVSYVLLYLAVSVGVTAVVAVVMLPAEQFTAGFSAGAYMLYAVVVALMIFFSGGASSELYLLVFPLVLAAALHGSWTVGITALLSTLFFYSLAMLPGLLQSGTESDAVSVLYRLAMLGLTGLFALFAARRGPAAVSEASGEAYITDEDGSMLLEQVERELSARRGVQVAVVLVDPGLEPEEMTPLLDRVRARIAEPVLVGEESVFGLVLSGVGERDVESAARRALAAASALGAGETRAGAAIYPRDARSAGDLLGAAGKALEAAFEVESPSAIVLAGRGTPRPERGYRAAR